MKRKKQTDSGDNGYVLDLDKLAKERREEYARKVARGEPVPEFDPVRGFSGKYLFFKATLENTIKKNKKKKGKEAELKELCSDTLKQIKQVRERFRKNTRALSNEDMMLMNLLLEEFMASFGGELQEPSHPNYKRAKVARAAFFGEMDRFLSGSDKS